MAENPTGVLAEMVDAAVAALGRAGERKSSPARIAANRRNALLSTGPRTPAGKAIVSRNSLRHGLTSLALIPGERPGVFQALAQGLLADFKPVGEVEGFLVERLASLVWRLRRVPRLEAGMLEWERLERRAAAAFFVSDPDLDPRDQEPAVEAGNAFAHLERGDMFTKLSKYEVGLERSLFRTLHELQRLQAMRRGERVLPPVTVDVNADVRVDASAADLPRLRPKARGRAAD